MDKIKNKISLYERVDFKCLISNKGEGGGGKPTKVITNGEA